MNTTQIKEFAQLSQASYAYFRNVDVGNAEDTKTDLKVAKRGVFTDAEAKLFTNRYEFLNQSNDTLAALGFSASLFRDKQDGRLVLAVRGTDGIFTDLILADSRIGIDGYASSQAVPLYRYIKQLMTPPGQPVQYTDDELNKLVTLSRVDLSTFPRPAEYVAQFKLSIRADVGVGSGSAALIQPGAFVDITGHSLGGHLALLAQRLFPNLFGEVVTFNAPGFDATGSNSVSVLSKFSSGWDASKITRVQAAGDNVHNIGSRFPGNVISVGQENNPGLAASVSSNHSVVNSADGLAITELLATIDPRYSLSPNLAKILFDAAANVPGQGYESLLDGLRKVFLGPNIVTTPINDGTDPASRNPLYINIENLKGKISTGGPGQFVVDSLVDKSSSALKILASDSSMNGIAYRYSLRELNSFVVLSADYSQNNQNGELDLNDPTTGKGTVTTQYLNDRAAMLTVVNKRNIADIPYSQIQTGAGFSQQLFNDISKSIIIRNGVGTDDQRQQFIFGDGTDRTISGGGTSDHLYAGRGNDTLNGLGGDDYLEADGGNDLLDGGSGNDTLVAGTGNVTLVGGAGNDALVGGGGNDTFKFSIGDGRDTITGANTTSSITVTDPITGNTTTLTGGKAKVPGSKLWQNPDGSVKYTLIGSGTNQDLLITYGNGDSITIKDFKANEFGISLTDGEPIAVSNPVITSPSPVTSTTIFNAQQIPVTYYGGQDGNYQIVTGGGLNEVRVGNGNSSITGGSGNDIITFGGGSNWIAGNGTADGANGNNVITANGGQDVISVRNGDNRIYGGEAVDILTALTQTRSASASMQRGNFINVGGGNNTIVGGNGNDAIVLGGGNNLVIAGPGDVTIDGGLRAFKNLRVRVDFFAELN